MMVEILMYVVGFLCVAVIVMGFVQCDEWEISLEIINPGTTTFELGVSNKTYDLEDEGVEHEFRVGFILVVLVLLFRKVA
jgi:hypothetical protein